MRACPHPAPKPRTAAQLRAQAEFGGASLGWNDLTEEQRDAWCGSARRSAAIPAAASPGP